MRALLIGLIFAMGTQPAFAQNGWIGRARVSVSVGWQADAGGVSEETSVIEYLEPMPIATGMPATAVSFVDAGLVIRLLGNLGAGVAVSSLNAGGDARVNAQVPHPFHFNRPRSVTGEAYGVHRQEVGVHTDVVYLAPVSDRLELIFQAGATFFQVTQDLVSDVTYSETYPFDTAIFSKTSAVQIAESRTGYNAGVDVTWKVSPRWGIGGLVRFSRAHMPFEVNGATAATIDVGGLQAGGGLRLAF